MAQFEMIVDDVFLIQLRGIILTGSYSGVLKAKDKVVVMDGDTVVFEGLAYPEMCGPRNDVFAICIGGTDKSVFRAGQVVRSAGAL